MTIKQGEIGQEMKASMLQEYHEDRGPEAGKPKVVSHSGKDMLLLSYFENKVMKVHFYPPVLRCLGTPTGKNTDFYHYSWNFY